MSGRPKGSKNRFNTQVKIVCHVCTKKFYVCFARKNEAKYCSHKCSGISRLGNSGYWKGKKRAIETNEKIRQKLKGVKQPPRSKEYCENISKSKRGPRSVRWQGERVSTVDGYIKVYSPNHPNAKYSRMAEHRLIPEKYLGRCIKTEERVHHINKNTSDNRIENLMVFKNHGYHVSFHRWGHCKPIGIVFDGRTI